MINPKGSSNKALSTDLRKSHFELGHSDIRNKQSEYVQRYQPKAAHLEESQKDKLNLRASHFSLGDYDSTKGYRSTNTRDFQAHPGFIPPSLNEDKKRDLRTHHFVFGGYASHYNTTTGSIFQEKHTSIEKQREEQEAARAKMIKHNHQFAETSQKMYASEYNKTFGKEFDPSSLRQGLTAEQIKQKVVDLRRSHVILGEDQRPMKTVAMSDYKAKNSDYIAPANDNVAIRRTNFNLGDNKTEYQTVTSSYYVEHPVQANDRTVFEALRTDLRAHHFSLGGEAPMYATNTMASFKKHDQYRQNEPLDPNLYQNHWTIGDEGKPILNKTTYSSTHKEFGNAVVNQARDQSQDRGSSWKLGNQKVPWISQSKATFTRQDGGPESQDANLKQDLRRSHFQFNDIKKPLYTSEAKATFVPKDGAPSTLNEELKKDLRTHHFKYGTTKTLMVSQNQATYRPNDGKPSNLDPNLAKDLRTHHFTHGDGKWQSQAITEYRTNYDWKVEGEQRL